MGHSTIIFPFSPDILLPHFLAFWAQNGESYLRRGLLSLQSIVFFKASPPVTQNEHLPSSQLAFCTCLRNISLVRLLLVGFVPQPTFDCTYVPPGPTFFFHICRFKAYVRYYGIIFFFCLVLFLLFAFLTVTYNTNITYTTNTSYNATTYSIYITNNTYVTKKHHLQYNRYLHYDYKHYKYYIYFNYTTFFSFSNIFYNKCIYFNIYKNLARIASHLFLKLANVPFLFAIHFSVSNLIFTFLRKILKTG